MTKQLFHCSSLLFVQTFTNSSEHAGDVSHLSSVQQSVVGGNSQDWV